MRDSSRPALFSVRAQMITSLTQLGGKAFITRALLLRIRILPPSTLDLSQLEGHSGRERGAALSAEWPGFQKQKSSLRGAAWDAPPD